MNSLISQIFMALHGLLLWLFLATWGLAGWFAGSLIRGFMGRDQSELGLILGLLVGLVWAVIIFGPAAVLVQVYRDNRRIGAQLGLQLEILQATLKHHNIPFDDSRIKSAMDSHERPEAAAPDQAALAAAKRAADARKAEEIRQGTYRRPPGTYVRRVERHRGQEIALMSDGTASITGKPQIFETLFDAKQHIDGVGNKPAG